MKTQIPDHHLNDPAVQREPSYAEQCAATCREIADPVEVLKKVLAICPHANMFKSNISIANELRDLNAEIRAAIERTTR